MSPIPIDETDLCCCGSLEALRETGERCDCGNAMCPVHVDTGQCCACSEQIHANELLDRYKDSLIN